MKMKRTIAALCAALLLLALTGCREKKDAGVSRGGSGDFCVAVGSMPDGFNPFTASSALSREFFLLVYDPLWRCGPDYTPQNCLADSYDISSDGLTWTIHLRQGVSFCDAAHTPLTSADVKFSYELFMQYADDAERDFAGIHSIRCPDAYTVVITTDYVKGDLMYNEVPILPESLWEACATDPYGMDNTAMIGTGPFVYEPVELEPGEVQKEWHFTARSDYFAGAAYIDSLTFRYYDLTTNASNALVDGLVDACMDLKDVQLFSLEGVMGVETYEVLGPTRGYCELVMNTASGALSDSVVRDAIQYAADKAAIFSMSFGDVGVREDGFIGPYSPFHLSGEEQYPLSPQQSAALLNGSLYQDYDGDGVLESRDNTMELRFHIYCGEEDAWAAAAATILARDLNELGFDITWSTVEQSVLTSKCRKGGDWDMCLISYAGSIDPQDTAERYANGNSRTGWQSEEYDSIFEQLRTCTELSQKIELCQKLQSIVKQSYPGITLGYLSTVQAVRVDKWTGYQDCLDTLGGLFGTGSVLPYLSVRALGTEAIEDETMPEPADLPDEFEGALVETPATAVPVEQTESELSGAVQ